MKEPHRRGDCPGLSAPMPTGVGLLVRFLPAEQVSLDAFVGFCEAARRHGNGTIEISARGSLQVRGLTPHSAPLFATTVAELGIAIHDGIPVIAGPLVNDADVLVDTTHVAAEVREAIANARLVLFPKVSVVLDGDGALHLDALSADIRLRAVGPAQQPRICVGLGGDGASTTWLGSIAPKDAVGAVLGFLTIIAGCGPTARAAEVLRTDGVGVFRSVFAGRIGPPWAPSGRMPVETVGLHVACDGTITVGIGLAFGYAHADTLEEIVRIAAIHRAQAVRPAPDRALLLIGVAEPKAVHLRAAAERLGFVVYADDPRRRIAACPGAPACASGLIPARALASALTPILESMGVRLSCAPAAASPSPGVAVHISGCLKGCAHPMPAALTLVGTPRGCGVIHHGTAHATPDHYVDPADFGAEISRILANADEVAHG